MKTNFPSIDIKYTPTLNLDIFIDEENKSMVKEYICPLCNGICYDPIIDQCSHMFCRKCYQTFTSIKKENINRCPILSSPLSSKPVTVLIVAKIINESSVFCRNKSLGCLWKGKVNQFIEHIEVCEYGRDRCKYCNSEIMRKIYNEHLLECSKMKMKCPNNCGAILEKEKIEEHILIKCNKSSIKCDFEKVGCGVKGSNEEIKKHLKDTAEEHLKLLRNYVVNLVEQIDDIKKIINSNCIDDKNKIAALKKHNNFSNFNTNKDISNLFLNRKTVREITLNYISDQNQQNNQSENSNALDDDNNNDYNDYPIEINSSQLSNDLISAKPKSIFDIESIPHGTIISKNQITFKSNSKAEHKYVFSTIELSKDKSTSWIVKLKTISPWIAFGVCDKEKVISNEMKFFSLNSQFNHGSFLFSTNNYLWNCNIEKENNFHITNMLNIQKNKEIIFTYIPKKKILSFKIDSFTSELTEVRPIIDDNLTICIVFLHSGDCVELSIIE